MILEVSSRVIEEHGRPIGIQGICRDITARKHAELALHRLSELNRQQALHDSLTGLPNRANFSQQVEHAIGIAEHDGSQLAVLLMDLDRFKEVNDTLGHRYGDLLLVELATRLASVVRRSDTVARLGGDEFGILVRQLGDSPDDLDETLARTLAALDQPFQVDGLPLHVEGSIGVARYPAHGRDIDLLLQRADVAMYQAKQTGRSCAEYAAELDSHDTASLTLLSELPRALRDHELVLHYQPKVDVRTGELAGIEALTRWQHPTRGLIPPGEFVPAAEKTGLIQPLTRYVLDEALGQLSRLDGEGHRLTLAVNLSMRNLQDPTLPEQVAELLRARNISGDRLTLEITESAIVSDPARTKVVIARLRELAVGVAIDDFGTGYTSLSYLARLAITQLKIDRSFIFNMHGDADDAAIVRSITTLGHDLGLEVVAEGVETRSHLRPARASRLRHRAGLLAEPAAASRRAPRVARPRRLADARGRCLEPDPGTGGRRAGMMAAVPDAHADLTARLDRDVRRRGARRRSRRPPVGPQRSPGQRGAGARKRLGRSPREVAEAVVAQRRPGRHLLAGRGRRARLHQPHVRATPSSPGAVAAMAGRRPPRRAAGRVARARGRRLLGAQRRQGDARRPPAHDDHRRRARAAARRSSGTR